MTLILKCMFKDGGCFGLKTQETIMGLSVTGLSAIYLSITRREELNEYFAW